MHEYDTAFKLILQHVDLTFRELLGTAVTRWHNVEFPDVRSGRADLLGETETGELIHIELQSTNDAKMPLRMLQYCVDVLRLFDRCPRQVLLYVGDAPAGMETGLHGPELDYSYRLVDVRELDGEHLLKSQRVEDNIIALLTRLPDPRASARLVAQRIAGLAPGEREAALDRLLILAGLRKALGKVIEEEARKMPILNDIMDHEVIGPEIKKGIELGIQQGVQQGIQQGELTVLRRQIEKRFGSLPDWAEVRLSQRSAKELEELSIRVLDARTIEELLQ
jgi:hypothetical protein